MRIKLRNVSILLLLLALSGYLATGPLSFGQVPDDDQEAKVFVGDRLPGPPQQKAPWTPPNGNELPAPFLRATGELFDLGLADPRGCEYRSVRIHVGDVWSGGGAAVEVHAWVIPAAKADPNSGAATAGFAVAWNGLVYPVISVGEKADLKADVAALCAADEDQRKQWDKEHPGNPFYRFRNSMPEEISTSQKHLLPIKACLLVRLGETALAQRCWDDWTGGMRANTNDDATHLKDPFLMLAGDLLWARFDRAVTEHMRGEDHLALIDAQALLAEQKAADALADKHGFQKEQPGQTPATTYFRFLEPVAELETDSKRRVTEPPRLHVARAGEQKFPDQTKRIAALIDDLDQVNARQWGQPGGVSLGSDPVVQALIQEGDPAVEPLLQCLEKDDRLTRSVHFWRDFAPYRSLIGVREAAYVALAGILDQSFFSAGSTGDDLSSHNAADRQALVKAIRAYWQKYKGLSHIDRWYAVLANDSASPEQWIEAAANISRPTNVQVTPGSMFATETIETSATQPSNAIPLQGEPLRKKQGPSVSELLVKRLGQLSHLPDDQWSRRLRSACTLADGLAAWDGAAHLDTLRDFSNVLRARFDRSQTGGGEYLVQPIETLYEQRLRLGDASAADEYAQWVVTLSPKSAQYSMDKIFEIIWKHPKNRALSDAAEKVFDGPNSPWNPVFQKSTGSECDSLISTPALGMPAFQKQLLRELDNTDRAGTVTITDEGGMSIQTDWSNAGTGMRDKDDPLKPKANVAVPFRMCDLIAYKLTAADGLPRMELYWPLPQRDAAIAQARQTLQRYGANMQWSPMQEKLLAVSAPAIVFSPLDHPATAADVAAGKAIFSSTKPSRLWKLPATLPIRAVAFDLHAMPSIGSGYDTIAHKSFTVKSWRQEGWIWQAEEILENGKWTAYVGFVGPGFIGRIPASEIELKPEEFSSPWSDLGHGVQCRLQLPGEESHGNVTVVAPPYKLHAPMPVKLLLRNALAVAQEVPLDWYRAGEHSLRDGLNIRLQRSSGGNLNEDAWSEISPISNIAHFKPEDRHKTFATLEQTDAAMIDISSLFNIVKAGRYRVILEQDTPSGGNPTQVLCLMEFQVIDK